MFGLKMKSLLFFLLLIIVFPVAVNSQIREIEKQILDSGIVNRFDERDIKFYHKDGVEVEINLPKNFYSKKFKRLHLILYLLPNGNSIEWTKGKKMNEGDDWHYDIQHVAAQVRFLRAENPEVEYVVIYLKSEYQSWPHWRRTKNDADVKILNLVKEFKSLFSDFETDISFISHSGGGSFVFGLINSVEKIPDYINRIVFIDSNYGYEDSLRHGEKLAEWLRRGDHKLIILAYEDRNVIIDGKNIVSPTGGTYYRSLMMKNFLQNNFNIRSQLSSEFSIYFDDNHKLIFYLKENPENKIYHTVLVELNGVIHGMFWATNLEEINYKFWGERAYADFVSEE